MRMGCQLRCFMLADDIRFAVEGPEEEVGHSIVDITDEAAYILEDVLHMQLSRDGGGSRERRLRWRQVVSFVREWRRA